MTVKINVGQSDSVSCTCTGPVNGSNLLPQFHALSLHSTLGKPDASTDSDLPLLLPTVMSFGLNLAAMAAPHFPISVRELNSMVFLVQSELLKRMWAGAGQNLRLSRWFA